jgi:hypothetical protein
MAKKPCKLQVQTHISPPKASEVDKPGRSPDMIQAPGVLIARDTNNIHADLQNHQKFISYHRQISRHLVEHLTIRHILDYKTRQHPTIFTQREKESRESRKSALARPKHLPKGDGGRCILTQHKHARNRAKTHKRESNHNPEPTTSIRIASAS